MSFFVRIKNGAVLLALGALLSLLAGCGFKPAYLQKTSRTEVSNRWKVERIDPSRLTADESAVYEKFGLPKYVRFFRTIEPERLRVYEWVYTDPVHLAFFIDGRKVEYVAVDDDTSPLNETQRKWLYRGGIAAGVVAGLGGATYFFFFRD
ncbi:MAG: hypothetical protein HY697_00960 [Deltaproteobacteria bacterium]|nr:hypothetical protein [Deltaproteobacteria bacterium]